MDKLTVVHLECGILFDTKKKCNYHEIKREQNWAIGRDSDWPRDYHTEWSKSGREKQISYTDTYRWNLEKWYSWTYLQSRKRDTDAENKCMDTKEGKLGWDELRHWDWHIHTDMYEIGQWEPAIEHKELCTLWWPWWEGNTCWFTSLNSRN